MTERGDALPVGPSACPFVALELDRDKRSDKPDYRHRCFAEPTPQPRAISHQAAYCLSPNFSACPIFQDWAVRAAANPIVTTTAAAAGAAVEASDAPAQPAMPAPVVMATDIQPELPAPGEGWPTEAFAAGADQPEDAEQLSVFAPPPVDASPPAAAQLPAEPLPYAPPAPQYSTSQPSPAYVPPPSDDLYAKPLDRGYEQPDDAPVPGFLAGRPERPARSSRPAEFHEKVSREDLIPSWDRDGRYGAEPAERERTDRFGGIVTAIAVIAILGLGVAGVIFLPGLLAGTGGPSRTPTPVASAPPSGGVVVPSVIATPIATITPSPSPDVTAAPTPTPHTYRVKKGDSLTRIARKFDVTVEEILAANPQIEDPDHIQPGDVITIPPPSQ